jgi:hypothetical protein
MYALLRNVLLALFAFLLFLPRRMFLIVAGFVFAVGLTTYAAKFDIPAWATVATKLLLEFYLGTVIAFLFIQGYWLPPLLAIVGSAASIATLLLLGDPVPSDWMMRVLYWATSGNHLVGSSLFGKSGVASPTITHCTG